LHRFRSGNPTNESFASETEKSLQSRPKANAGPEWSIGSSNGCKPEGNNLRDLQSGLERMRRTFRIFGFGTAGLSRRTLSRDNYDSSDNLQVLLAGDAKTGGRENVQQAADESESELFGEEVNSSTGLLKEILWF
jgi:hypothetical protein